MLHVQDFYAIRRGFLLIQHKNTLYEHHSSLKGKLRLLGFDPRYRNKPDFHLDNSRIFYGGYNP